jgi:hypothetical protein
METDLQKAILKGDSLLSVALAVLVELASLVVQLRAQIRVNC